MNIDDAGFREISRTEGKLKIDIMGQTDEMPYKSRNFMNADGTIGCAEVEVGGKAGCMFISNTERGIVMTMAGEENGPFPMEVEGYHAIMCVEQGNTFEQSYKIHRDALEGKKLIADEEWLRKTVPEIPRRALDAATIMLRGAAGMMEELGQAMGQAMEGVAKGMAEAMGGAMEGMSRGLAEAMGGGVGEAGGPKKPKAKKARKPKKGKG